MARDAEDLICQQFLQMTYELAITADRWQVKGLEVKKRLDLEHQEYLSIVDALHKVGYIYAPGALAADISLTEKGVRRVKNS